MMLARTAAGNSRLARAGRSDGAAHPVARGVEAAAAKSSAERRKRGCADRKRVARCAVPRAQRQSRRLARAVQRLAATPAASAVNLSRPRRAPAQQRFARLQRLPARAARSKRWCGWRAIPALRSQRMAQKIACATRAAMLCVRALPSRRRAGAHAAQRSAGARGYRALEYVVTFPFPRREKVAA